MSGIGPPGLAASAGRPRVVGVCHNVAVPPHRVELLIKHGEPLEGVDLDDRDKLYERMEEQQGRKTDAR